MTASGDVLPFPVLLADIGGTNARFAMVTGPDTPLQVFPIVATNAYPSPDAAALAVLAAAGAPHPRAAVLAFAGPIEGARPRLTNANWAFDVHELIAALALDELVLVNDFEALSLALPVLSGDALMPIGGGRVVENAPRVVVGPGTGMGVGGLIHSAGRWVPLPSEAGHCDLGPVTDADFALWPALERAHGRITPETVLSGPGLLRLYKAVAKVAGRAAACATPAEVTAAAEAGDDLAAATLDHFSAHLARFAGNLALTYLARGGVYLAGGIAPRIESHLTDGRFRAMFEDKAPHTALVREIPTFLIRHPLPALEGLAAFARTPHRFFVPASHRFRRG
ncbi:glucokinase [Pseudoxanthobacter sp.]|uniref:glucokinase n=1 Tax=Pseudoxanthobacter sp. TaxID=1925742 RepID=UPI002FE29E81